MRTAETDVETDAVLKDRFRNEDGMICMTDTDQNRGVCVVCIRSCEARATEWLIACCRCTLVKVCQSLRHGAVGSISAAVVHAGLQRSQPQAL